MKLCTYEQWNKTQHGSNLLQMFFTIIFALLGFAVIVGNSLVIFEAVMNKTRRATTRTLILSIAIANWMDGIMVLPFTATNKALEGYWIFGNLWCTTNIIIYIWLCTVSIYNIVALSLDRLIAITKPLHYPMLVTSDRMCKAVAAIWIGSLLLSSPAFLFVNADESMSDQCRCIPINGKRAYIIVSATLSFYIPMLIIAFISTKVYKTTRKAITRTSLPETTTSCNTSQSEQKLYYIQYKVFRGIVQIGKEKVKSTGKNDEIERTKARGYINRNNYTDPNMQSMGSELSDCLKHTASEPWDMKLQVNKQSPKKERDYASEQFNILMAEGQSHTSLLRIPDILLNTKHSGTSNKKQSLQIKTAQRVAIANTCVIFSKVSFSILYGFSLNANPQIWSISLILSHFNSALSPIVYFFLNRDFRNYLNVLFTRFTNSISTEN